MLVLLLDRQNELHQRNKTEIESFRPKLLMLISLGYILQQNYLQTNQSYLLLSVILQG